MNLLAIVWDVSPEIFSIGPLSVRYYGLLFALAFLAGYYILQNFFKKEGMPTNETDKVVTCIFIGTILGARLGHVFFYEPVYYLQNPSEIIQVWHGGLASHGGAIGIIIALFIYAKKSKKKFLWIIDRVGIPVALAACFIRIGNLMNSEIYGVETNLLWGFIFVKSGEEVPKHPTQIYEAFFYLLIFIFLKFAYEKHKGKLSDGLIAGWFLTLLFGVRFFIEFFKEVQVNFETEMILNMGQLLSIPCIISGILLILYAKKVTIQ